MSSIVAAKKWSKSLAVALSIFVSAVFVTGMIVTTFGVIQNQFEVVPRNENSQEFFKCELVFSENLRYAPYDRCNLGSLLVSAAFEVSLFAISWLYILLLPFTLTGNAVNVYEPVDIVLPLIFYAYIFFLTFYISRSFVGKEDRTLDRVLIKRAWLTTLVIMLLSILVISLSF